MKEIHDILARIEQQQREILTRLDHLESNPPEEEAQERISSSTVDVRQLAAILGCSERTIWRHEGKGLIPGARRVGGVVRWSRQEIDDFLAA